MTPNLDFGKTAVLLALQGKGAIEARKRLFGPQAPRKLSILTEDGIAQIHLVTVYTHLGCLLRFKGDMRQEARRRFSIAQSSFQTHRRILHRNPQLGVRRRAELCRTLILSEYMCMDVNHGHFVMPKPDITFIHPCSNCIDVFFHDLISDFVMMKCFAGLGLQIPLICFVFNVYDILEVCTHVSHVWTPLIGAFSMTISNGPAFSAVT